MRYFPLAVCILLFYNSAINAQARKTKVPEWVVEVVANDDEKEVYEGNYRYLLLDFQDNLVNKNRFVHYAIKILKADGVQDMSDISVSYDPIYQKLEFHQIQLIREDTILNKLKNSKINIFQRETKMERSLYDGSLTAVINLSDVREGDIIEYSYTIIGFNPINKGHYSTTIYQEYTSPVSRIYNRLVTDSKKNIHYKLLEGAIEPKIKKNNNTIEYIWDIDGSKNKLYDNNVPSWLNSQKRVSISTFKNWKEVANWAINLYPYNSSELIGIEDITSKNDTKENQILKSIRFVQDEVRYLGFESGIGAYKPNRPAKVYKQRFGDCKDKSFLLVSLLRDKGVSAFPLLVNTQLKQEIKSFLPSHNIFDHCIVYFEHNNKKYFVDPTISNQGGNLEHLSTPRYKTGLLIKRENNELIEIAEGEKSSTTINETIVVDSIGGSATFLVKSEYTGGKANYMRGYFNKNSKEVIQKEYLNYYSNIYPDIALKSDIKFNDTSRGSSNKFVVEEFYNIEEFWLNSDDDSYIYCEIYPLVLESSIDYPTSAKRNMPYYLGTPFSFYQKTTITLPEEWSIKNSDIKISGEGFQYDNVITGFGKSISIEHKYELKQEIIPGKSVSLFHKKHEDIQSELPYYLTYNESLSGFKLSWISIMLSILAIGTGIFFAIKLYKKYSPEPSENCENMSIGGWLVLPAIGLTLTPFVIMVQLFSEDFFNHNSWLSFNDYETGQAYFLKLILGTEIIYNSLFLVFSILVLIFFFKKRTGLPRLISIFYIISFLFPLIDSLLVDLVVPDLYSSEENFEVYKDIGKSFIGVLVWVPYFNISTRVKNTFCKIYQI